MASQDQNKSKLHKMVQYIVQDGNEKAEEIDVIAEEEYYIERNNYLDSRIGAVTKYYDNLENKYQQQIILDVSRIKNEAYKTVLNARSSVLNEIFDTVSRRITQLTHNENGCLYKRVMYQLTIQGLVKIMEPNIVLRVRKADVELTKRILKQAENYFHRTTGMVVKVCVDEDGFLPHKTNGGILMSTKCGSISLDNTLDARLGLIRNKVVPYVRWMLFGPNPNRLHID